MKPLAVPAAVLAACLALLGCSRGETNVQSGNAAGILHRGIGPDLADLDPQLATHTTDYSVLSALFEGLTSEDPVDLHPLPGVAERWTTSADGLNYTFYLRRDARWSDGTAVTAADFIASWKRILSPSFGSTTANQLYILQGAEAFNKGEGDFSQVGIKAEDTLTLSVTLEHAAPWFLTVLSSPAWLPVPIPLVARHGAIDQPGNAWATAGGWIGNGPFVLESWHRGLDIRVRKSPTYWDRGNVALQAIEFHAIESIDAEERAFRTGQLHVTETLPPERIDSYRRDSPQLLRTDPLLGTYFIRVNVRRPGLNDSRIRMALALAVDRSVIAEKLLRGGQQPASAFTPPGIGGYSPDPVQQRDADRARRLLADAGQAGGGGLPQFTLLYNTSDVHRVVAEALQEMWRRELGVQVSVLNEELKGTLEARRTGSYDLLLSSWIADYADPSAFLDIWRGDSVNNFTGWSNGDYDALLFSAARSGDPAARNGAYQKAERLMLGEAPIITLYHYTHVFLIQPSVEGWHPTLLDHHPYKYVSLHN